MRSRRRNYQYDSVEFVTIYSFYVHVGDLVDAEEQRVSLNVMLLFPDELNVIAMRQRRSSVRTTQAVVNSPFSKGTTFNSS